MKNLFGFTGFTGFMVMICSAGESGNKSFGITAAAMLAGFGIMVISMILVKLHIERRRKKRRLYMKKRALSMKKGKITAVPSAKASKDVPKGISLIVSEKINSPEFC